jgi:hypothetical protein
MLHHALLLNLFNREGSRFYFQEAKKSVRSYFNLDKDDVYYPRSGNAVQGRMS